jgi:hypothetical protein
MCRKFPRAGARGAGPRPHRLDAAFQHREAVLAKQL